MENQHIKDTDMDERQLVAIDIGTSKIALTVAKVTGDNVQIIYYRETPSAGIRYSRVINPSKASGAIRQAIATAEEELGTRISDVIVGLPKYDVQQNTAPLDIKRNADTCISQDEINEIKESAMTSYPLDNKDSEILFGAVAQSFGDEDNIQVSENDIIGMAPEKLTCNFKVFIGQKKYVEAIKKNTVVFGVGPAGTGKTYLAVCLAVSAFKGKQVEKIILTRPAVEAGEKLGFLPGDLQTKVDPYLRPLYDALQEMFGMENYLKLMERGVIEVAPLAYMRGRTLSNAFIILDEAQNTTVEQMKMFLTRMGDGSKVVVTGDVTQIDLPEGKRSGLKHAVSVLKNIEGIETVTLTAKDVVRHPLVMQIVRAYERDASRRETTREERKRR